MAPVTVDTAPDRAADLWARLQASPDRRFTDANVRLKEAIATGRFGRLSPVSQDASLPAWRRVVNWEQNE